MILFNNGKILYFTIKIIIANLKHTKLFFKINFKNKSLKIVQKKFTNL